MYLEINNLRDFGAALRKERKQLGLSQEALASRAMLKRQTIINIEKGEDANISTILKLLSAIGKRIDIKDNRPDMADITGIFDEP